MRVFPVVFAVLLASACDEDHGYRSPQTCELACRRSAECGRVSASGCAESCRAPLEPALRLNPRYLDAVRRCLAAQPCGALAADACEYEEALRLSPSKAAEALCRRAREDERSCASTLDPVSCLDDVKIYDDSSLMRLSRCFDGPCADRAGCLRGVYGPAYPFAR